MQTIADESSPPLRHVPTGTSLTRRRLVASVKSSANRSSAPAPLAFATGSSYQHTSAAAPPGVTRSRWPGGSERTPRKNVSAVLVDEAVREVVVDDVVVGRRLDRAEREQRLDLRRERERAARLGIDERLDPVAVAAADEEAALRVPQSERPHAVEAVEALLAPLLVRVHDDLGVGVRVEPVPARLELAPQLDEVVDLAVVDDPDAPVLVAERLVSRRREVLDREPPGAEREVGGLHGSFGRRRVRSAQAPHLVGRVGAAVRRRAAVRRVDRDVAFVVRAAVSEGRQRGRESRDVDGRSVTREVSDDPAHGAATLPGR